MRLSCRPRADPAASSPRAEGGKGGFLVFFSAAPALTIREVQDAREKALAKAAAAMLVVSPGRISPVVRRGVQELGGRFVPGTAAALLKIQVFDEAALGFNITRHASVPRHEVLSAEEAAAFLAERKLGLSQLPRVLESDPVVQYFGIARGAIVRILRTSKETGPYVMYRQVV
ncbi:unnamed protein product [Phytomonas sp. Hart1]|nr:unnamed protein product [Phytomonas sp. Hart1]|eukprot:CCW69158.1 unnamed protein product [Phytomonas sp. isolate Hart1]